MNTYILVWNPAKWTFQDWPQALADMREQGSYVRQWSCVNTHVQPGDQILLKKTGKGLTGIIASGVAVSVPFNNRHWGKGKQDRPKQYIQVKFDRLADYTKGEILPVNDKEDFGFVPQASGCKLAENKAASLLQRFHDYVVAPVIVPVVIAPTEKKRVGLSVRLRYQILERDFFRCSYCGKTAIAAELEVDHVISQKSWRETHGNLDGVNDPSNLVTACFECNSGKSAKCGNPPILEVIAS